ncbi:MAG: TIGR04282 family arsenosugar biosynthesis glycosyltransferase [Candidatus Omnitrophica bacterium]|nr:TIGR04282 family arsenosugar biosynthesis glycosyltransferase [Candidatus Omnitrophota bacterium]
MNDQARAMVFAKLPAVGCVKTRLAREVGELAAARLYEAWVPPFVATLTSMAPAVSVEVCLAVEPGVDHAHAAEQARQWLSTEAEVAFQCGEDLGLRLKHAFDRQFDRGWTQVLAIGSDSPQLSADIVRENLRLFENSDIILGPASDGGYYLLGLSRPPEDMFETVRWSCSTTFEDTLRAAKRKGWRAGIGPESYDIDTLADLERLLGEGEGDWSFLRRFLEESEGPKKAP